MKHVTDKSKVKVGEGYTYRKLHSQYETLFPLHVSMYKLRCHYTNPINATKYIRIRVCMCKWFRVSGTSLTSVYYVFL